MGSGNGFALNPGAVKITRKFVRVAFEDSVRPVSWFQKNFFLYICLIETNQTNLQKKFFWNQETGRRRGNVSSSPCRSYFSLNLPSPPGPSLNQTVTGSWLIAKVGFSRQRIYSNKINVLFRIAEHVLFTSWFEDNKIYYNVKRIWSEDPKFSMEYSVLVPK